MSDQECRGEIKVRIADHCPLRGDGQRVWSLCNWKFSCRLFRGMQSVPDCGSLCCRCPGMT